MAVKDSLVGEVERVKEEQMKKKSGRRKVEVLDSVDDLLAAGDSEAVGVSVSGSGDSSAGGLSEGDCIRWGDVLALEAELVGREQRIIERYEREMAGIDVKRKEVDVLKVLFQAVKNAGD